MKFSDYHIHEGIKKSISKLDYKKPTDIQFKCIPAILNGDDVLAIAQTGTGKTAAYVIPVLHQLNEMKQTARANKIKCLVMTPTHELALQTDHVFKSLGKHTRVQSMCIHGGVDQDPQIEQLNRGVDVLIATPGRLFDLISQGHVELEQVEYLIIDEADHMLALGFLTDIHDIVRKLTRKRQTLFFSATIDEKIKKLAYDLVRNPIHIRISPKDPVGRNIDHSVAFIEMDDKRFFLEKVLKSNPDIKVLIFVRTKIRAERVLKAMERAKISSESIHSDKTQQQREEIMQRFRSGENLVLIATDISARGIDVPSVEIVINYDLPEVPENYVHRVGRTGRAKYRGLAVSFCSKEEQELLKEIENYIGKEIARQDLSKSEYNEIRSSVKDETNWQSLIDENEAFKSSHPKKNKKRK